MRTAGFQRFFRMNMSGNSFTIRSCDASCPIRFAPFESPANYNRVCVAYGLPPVCSFAEITSDVALQQSLKAAYGTVGMLDLWVGVLAENHAPGASVGATFQRIIAHQFMRLCDGDRFWYEKDLSGATLAQVRSTTLATVIRNNTTINQLQTNIFFFRTG